MGYHVAVIHGSPRKGNTYRAAQIFLEELAKRCDVRCTEFFLPQDMPHFCAGCFRCFEVGEECCPHRDRVGPIVEAMAAADGVVFTTPVYVLAESGAMKALLDHFGYLFLVHRPMEEMFSKSAVVISTTAGAGTRHALKTIARCIRYLGVHTVLSCGLTMFAVDWDSLSPKRAWKFHRRLARLAARFARVLGSRGKRTPIFTRVMFSFMRRFIGNQPVENLDRQYWDEKGWLSKERRPF